MKREPQARVRPAKRPRSAKKPVQVLAAKVRGLTSPPAER